jgi:hypothetical protein
MDERAEQTLLANVKAITDRLDLVDKVFKAARIGVDMVLVFQCNESGLYYPGDFVRGWGLDWGLLLGPDVCSESLQSQYDVAPPLPDRTTLHMDQIMHPLRVSRAQVDAHLVERSIAEANMAVPAKGDEEMRQRAPILLLKQRANPISRLHAVQGLSVSEAAYRLTKKGWG